VKTKTSPRGLGAVRPATRDGLTSCTQQIFFSLVLLFVGVVNALIMGEIEDHVWFDDRWMVSFLCDE
jgi:hypothetical protein